MAEEKTSVKEKMEAMKKESEKTAKQSSLRVLRKIYRRRYRMKMIVCEEFIRHY